jgi:hypothetical protein
MREVTLQDNSNRDWLRLQEFGAGKAADQDADPARKLNINVIFNGEESTCAAVRTATRLARGLRARVNVLAFQLVPLPFELSQPPVSIPFARQRLVEFANRTAEESVETAVRLCLCRHKDQALLQALEPGTPVVVGGKKRKWATKESRMVRLLSSKGFQVIFAEAR